MRFLVCPDSFKDSMKATTVAEIIARAIQDQLPDSEIITVPLSDGGQGFINSILKFKTGTRVDVTVTGPLGKPKKAYYALIDSGKTAIIEMAQAAGLELLNESERNPYYTSTFGVGELIKAALKANVNKIIIGLGGSATNDAGAGMLQALGVKLLDNKQHELQPGGINLKNLANIDFSSILPELKRVKLEIACDVTNPLTGPNGATAIYSRQKGATSEMVQELEKALVNFKTIVESNLSINRNQPGSGAAGGLAYGLLCLGGKIKSGFDLIANYIQIENLIQNSDYVISAEGSIDEQTTNGKTISGIARLCKKHYKPLIALCGKRSKNLNQLYQIGVTAIFSINDGSIASLPEVLAASNDNLYLTTQNIIKLLSCQSK